MNLCKSGQPSKTTIHDAPQTTQHTVAQIYRGFPLGIELYVVGSGEKEARRHTAPNKGWFRKPGPGMLKWAIEYYKADTALMVGDRQEDEAAAAASSLNFWQHHNGGCIQVKGFSGKR